MARFLIEVPHEEEIIACAKVVQVFLATGSHYLTHADWGCEDGDHRSWMIVDVDTKEDARAIVPAAFRSQARITKLNSFSMNYIESVLSGRRSPDPEAGSPKSKT
jgi:hypothetical protein